MKIKKFDDGVDDALGFVVRQTKRMIACHSLDSHVETVSGSQQCGVGMCLI